MAALSPQNKILPWDGKKSWDEKYRTRCIKKGKAKRNKICTLHKVIATRSGSTRTRSVEE